MGESKILEPRVAPLLTSFQALCIRMDRSQQGVCPRTCLSKLPLKPRPTGPPKGPTGARPNGPPNGPPGARPNGPQNGPPGARPNGPPRGPSRPGPGPVVLSAAQAQSAQPSSNVLPRSAMVAPRLSPTPSSPSADASSPQKRSRSMSVSSANPTPQSQHGADSPTKPTPDTHRRSISLSSIGNANKPNTPSVGPSPLGVVTRKPVPGQAL